MSESNFVLAYSTCLFSCFFLFCCFWLLMYCMYVLCKFFLNACLEVSVRENDEIVEWMLHWGTNSPAIHVIWYTLKSYGRQKYFFV